MPLYLPMELFVFLLTQVMYQTVQLYRVFKDICYWFMYNLICRFTPAPQTPVAHQKATLSLTLKLYCKLTTYCLTTKLCCSVRIQTKKKSSGVSKNSNKNYIFNVQPYQCKLTAYCLTTKLCCSVGIQTKEKSSCVP